MAPSSLYLPGAKWRPISYRAAAGKFTHPPLGYVVHVPVSNGSLFAYFNGLQSPARKFCTAFIFKDGSSEQYTTLDMKAWAQGDGNGDYWSFEVEGYPNEPMTDAQLDTLARWHTFLGVDDAIATAPGQRGIGTHQMGGSAWGGHSCPGTIRTAQLPQIIQRAHGGNPQEDDMQLSDTLYNPITKEDATVGQFLQSINTNAYKARRDAAVARGLAEAAAKAARPLTAAEIDDIAAATVAALGTDYDANITLTPKETP